MRSENYPQLILRSETVLAVKGACRSFFLSVEKQAQNKNSVYRWPGESLAVAHVLGRDLADGVVRVRDGCGLWGPGHSGILSYRSPLAWVAARPRAAELVLDYRQSSRRSSCRLKSLVIVGSRRPHSKSLTSLRSSSWCELKTSSDMVARRSASVSFCSAMSSTLIVPPKAR